MSVRQNSIFIEADRCYDAYGSAVTYKMLLMQNHFCFMSTDEGNYTMTFVTNCCHIFLT